MSFGILKGIIGSNIVFGEMLSVICGHREGGVGVHGSACT